MTTNRLLRWRVLICVPSIAAMCFLGIDRVGAAVTADALLKNAGTEGGLVIHVGAANGQLTAALHKDDRFLVHGLDTDTNQVTAARKYLQSQGLCGEVSVDPLTESVLPHVDNLANLIVVQDTSAVPTSEVVRVLAPDGIALIAGDVLVPKNAAGSHVDLGGEKWTRLVKKRPGDIDEWTHYLHDASGNAVAHDAQVGPPKQIRWVSNPLWSRSHEFNPSMNGLVTAKGRMFYIFDEGMPGLPDLRFPARWALHARDAFSGKFLWRRDVPGWGYREWNTRGMWSAPLTLNRRVVTDGDCVFATLGYKAPLTVLDAATGKTIRTVAGTMGTDEIILSDGVVLLCVRDQLSVAKAPTAEQKKKQKRRQNPHEYAIGPPGDAALVAVDAKTGQELWRLPPQPVTILTLSALDGKVCFHGRDGITCLDLKTGQRQWATAARPQSGSRHSGGTLVMKDGVVLFTAADGLKAFALKDGHALWIGPKVSGPGVTHPPDLFVAGNMVWGGDEPGMHTKDRTRVIREGRDLQTGDVKRHLDVSKLISPLHHFRCYRSKSTDRFLLLTKRGIEFVDLEGQENMRNDWLRAMCHYGFLPANGLLYVPPHHCFCYPGVKMTGFLALTTGPAKAEAKTKRLVRGPAYGKVDAKDAAASDSDWPTYRGDALRSGHSNTPVPTHLKKAWQIEVGGKITQPISVAGSLYMARVDQHEVCCLDAKTGAKGWSFTAGGRVDSSPTYYRGLILFGCRDGWVYALRAKDGELAWRYRAAPAERRIVGFEQIESPWPVPGSVLILDDVAYVAAGRSSFLDGGVYLTGLKPQTGEVVCETVVNGPWPDVDKDPGRPFDMDGTKGDLLVTDGENIYLYQMAFDKNLKDITPPRASTLGDRIVGRHLMATGGFLDDSWYDRTYWTYSNRWPGFYYSNAAPKAGQILVFDDKKTYGLHVNTERLRLSPAFTPGDKGYELFCDDNDNEPVLASNSAGREKGPGFSRGAPPTWSKQVPVRARAMVLAGDKLVLAGPPDVVPDEDPYAAFEGRKGAKLWIVSAKDGYKLAEYPLKELPACDGLIAVGDRLYMTTTKGQLICFR